MRCTHQTLHLNHGHFAGGSVQCPLDHSELNGAFVILWLLVGNSVA